MLLVDIDIIELQLEVTKYPRSDEIPKEKSSLHYLEQRNILGYIAAATKYPSVKISYDTANFAGPSG